ncbi:PEP/pyruvate-binding domain-containing protein [Deinococcus sp. QL22]|uniref:PEP/pyruvate-binding domain-containing protein n=1 Tax=Deinococcus sp. QL22 TaxID=2939437 RepID=UPI0020183C59|nr:PEP/pyruvate-binding domain-containing protein [Deinococcus sp. QL22]UQN07955.1 PEP-utilizing enzyme [Deinococcus sp. QL22]
MLLPAFRTLVLNEALDISICGGKAATLARLLQAGVQTLDGMVLTTEALDAFLTSVAAPVDSARRGDAAACAAVREALHEAIWPDDTLHALRRVFEQFEGSVVVRSSAVSEDGEHASYAGIFLSSVNVRTFGEFLAAVRECWSSAFGVRAVSYVSRVGGTLPRMALLVQPLVESAVSGVAFVQGHQLMATMAYGLCEGVVSGRVPSDTIRVSGRGEPPVVQVAAKTHCRLANTHPWVYPEGRQTLWPWVNDTFLGITVQGVDARNAVLHCQLHGAQPAINEPALTPVALQALIGELYRVAHDVLRQDSVDFEWCVDMKGRLHVLQARPVTVAMAMENIATSEDTLHDVFRGLSVSPGVGSGIARVIRSDEDLERLRPGDILVTDWIHDSYLSALNRASALVIADATPLSHCAIIAREWGIPCVGGVPFGLLAEGRMYSISGDSGRIQEGSTGAPQAATAPASTKRSSTLLLPWLLTAVDEVNARPERRAVQLAALRDLLHSATDLNDNGVEEYINDLSDLQVKNVAIGLVHAARTQQTEARYELAH